MVEKSQNDYTTDAKVLESKRATENVSCQVDGDDCDVEDDGNDGDNGDGDDGDNQKRE